MQTQGLPNLENKAKWEKQADGFRRRDRHSQIFFLQLINVMQPEGTEHLLDVGCGRLIFLPSVLALLPPQASYTATDLAERMIQLNQECLGRYLQDMGSQLSVRSWLRSRGIRLFRADGQLPLQPQWQAERAIREEGAEIVTLPHNPLISEAEWAQLPKFNRIIANMVLMLTDDPARMLRNFYEHSTQDCLLGAAVWGEKTRNTLHQTFWDVVGEMGLPLSNRPSCYLYHKLADVALPQGWRVRLVWDQEHPQPFGTAEQVLDSIRLEMLASRPQSPEIKEAIMAEVQKRVKMVFSSSKPCIFSAECYVFEKVSRPK